MLSKNPKFHKFGAIISILYFSLFISGMASNVLSDIFHARRPREYYDSYRGEISTIARDADALALLGLVGIVLTLYGGFTFRRPVKEVFYLITVLVASTWLSFAFANNDQTNHLVTTVATFTVIGLARSGWWAGIGIRRLVDAHSPHQHDTYKLSA